MQDNVLIEYKSISYVCVFVLYNKYYRSVYNYIKFILLIKRCRIKAIKI